MTTLGSATEMPADEAVARWAASGAMALTGRADGEPLGPPAPLVARLDEVAARIERASARLGDPVRVDPLALLAERAAIGGLGRNGTVSCGGATRLLRCADGWAAITLAREDDVELVPAWLGVADPGQVGPWPVIAATLVAWSAGAAVERAVLVGLPAAVLPVEPVVGPRPPAPLAPLPCRGERLTERPPTLALEGVTVVDLSSLWAGPLCGSLLLAAGAEVVKVESAGRPDGARRGPAAFFDLLNAGKRSVAINLGDPASRAALQEIVSRADVVIEGSRPRALAQLGIDAAAMVRDGHPRVWVSITGHGRSGPGAVRVAFGDDAAVAGGLVAWEGQQPCFCADAIADPASGLVAAAAVLEVLAAGDSWLLDVSLAGVAAHLAGPTLPVAPGTVAAPPRARTAAGQGPALGADTTSICQRWGVRP